MTHHIVHVSVPRACRLAVCAVVAIACAAAPLAQSTFPVLRPVDAGAARPDFFTFRARLQAAVAKHDRPALMAVVSEGIRNTFGDDNGRDAFERRWRLADADSPLWGELGLVLALGGSFDDADNFIAPYVFSRWPSRFDAFEHAAILGDRVRVRAAPEASAATIGVLSFSVVPVLPAKEERPSWLAIRLPAAQTGYVSAMYARRPLDYRAIFSRTSTGWQMTAFIAGD